MGKWSTYRKRGGSTAPVALGPPPPPVLYFDDPDMHAQATGGDDTGGSFQSFHSVNEGGPWFPFDNEPWGPDVFFGESPLPGLNYYRAKEVGNGTAYVGDSDWSNVLPIEPE